MEHNQSDPPAISQEVRNTRNRFVESLVNEALVEAYWQASSHFKSQDLVLVLDLDEKEQPLCAFKREELIARPDTPPHLLEQFSKPACDVNEGNKLTGAPVAFWFVVVFPEEMAAMAVLASPMSAGGDA